MNRVKYFELHQRDRSMASHKSAKKCIRKAARRTLINKSRMSRVRTYVKKFENLFTAKTAVTAVDAQAAFVDAQSELAKAIHAGLLHKNTVARKISRMSKRLKAIAA